MAGFKPRFTGTQSATNAPAQKTWNKDRPFLCLRVQAPGEEKSTLMGFLSEREGKFGNYFSGKELILGDDGKSQKGPDGKTMTTDTTYFFDVKSLKLKAKVGTENVVICEMKPSTRNPGSYYGKDEEGNAFFADLPKKK